MTWVLLARRKRRIKSGEASLWKEIQSELTPSLSSSPSYSQCLAVPAGERSLLHPSSGCFSHPDLTGGLRFAPTLRLLFGNPPGCSACMPGERGQMTMMPGSWVAGPVSQRVGPSSVSRVGGRWPVQISVYPRLGRFFPVFVPVAQMIVQIDFTFHVSRITSLVLRPNISLLYCSQILQRLKRQRTRTT